MSKGLSLHDIFSFNNITHFSPNTLEYIFKLRLFKHVYSSTPAIAELGPAQPQLVDILLYISSLKLSRVAGWLEGWVVGKSDFKENPVDSLDFALDL